MKTVNLFSLSLLLCATAMFTACEELESGFEGTIFYSIDNPGSIDLYQEGIRYFTDCFSTSVTYRNEKGKLVTEENVTLPWKKEFKVKAPFNLKLEYSHALRETVALQERGYYVCTYDGDISKALVVRSNPENDMYKYTIVANTNYFYQIGYRRIGMDVDLFFERNGAHSTEWDFTEENWNRVYRYNSDKY